MDRAAGEIVLLTGASGFLGRHVLKYLVEDKNVKEIRALDKKIKGDEKIDTKKTIKFYQRDLVDLEGCREAFHGVHVVMHCAGLVSYDYPPNITELEKNNVDATSNVVRLCREEHVKQLIHCSTTEVTLQPTSKCGITAIVIYKGELEPPENSKRLIFGEYAASKLEAERIVLKANDTWLDNGDVLLTTALRPTLLYGEDDPHLLPEILQFAKTRGDSLPRLCGLSGKQQMTYVGNAAWAFIRAKETLKENPRAIAGLPVNVTDDTFIEDLTRFCERITRSGENHVKVATWSVPTSLSYVGALIFELLTDFGLVSKFKIPPCGMIAYLGSVLLYNRARASIHMNYWPKYNVEQSLAIASNYYGELCSKQY